MNPVRLREISRRGGLKTARLHDMAVIGSAGGRQTAKRGSRYFARIGHLGGKAFKSGRTLASPLT